MFFVRLLFLSSFVWIGSMAHTAAQMTCTPEDRKLMALIGGENFADEAFMFGLKIQEVVRKQDLNAFFALVGNRELEYGPRRAFVRGKEYGEIFSGDWQKMVLKSEPDCRGAGYEGYAYYGYSLPGGLVWYDKYRDGWRIVGVINATEEKFDRSEHFTWTVDGKPLPPQCFSFPNVTGGTFRNYAERFGIEDQQTFYENVGVFLGRHMPIEAMGDPSSRDESITIVSFLDECTNSNYELDIVDGFVQYPKAPWSTDTIYAYSVLWNVPTETCHELAPLIEGKCQQAHLVDMGYDGRGYYGRDQWYCIYGQFKLENGRQVLAPLKSFNTFNDAVNFLSDL